MDELTYTPSYVVHLRGTTQTGLSDLMKNCAILCIVIMVVVLSMLHTEKRDVSYPEMGRFRNAGVNGVITQLSFSLSSSDSLVSSGKSFKIRGEPVDDRE